MVTIAGIQDRDGAVRLRAALRAGFSTIVLIWADGGYAGRLVRWAQTVLALTVSFVKRTDDLTGFQVIPAAGSWNAPWPGSASTAAACGTTRPGPSTPRRWSTSPRSRPCPPAGPVSEFQDDAADTRPRTAHLHEDTS